LIIALLQGLCVLASLQLRIRCHCVLVLPAFILLGVSGIFDIHAALIPASVASSCSLRIASTVVLSSKHSTKPSSCRSHSARLPHILFHIL
jgi:hypothetical protein